MDIDNILKMIKTGNEHLDKLAGKYFVRNSKLNYPIIGRYSFNDVVSDFEYWLYEYSISNSKVSSLGVEKEPTSKELLKRNDIHINTYHSFTRKVDKVLKTYTDETWSIEDKRNILEKQIFEFANEYEHDEQEDTKYKMFQALSVTENDLIKRNRYLDSVISAMQKAEVNQLNDGKYMVIQQLFDTYNEIDEYLEDFNFKEKKKNLQKLNHAEPNKAKLSLVKYVKKFLDEEGVDRGLKLVRAFFFYLIYGKNKVDIYMIHSILGYKYVGGAKLYQKLFCKDHSTGQNNKFSHHTSILNVQKEDIIKEDYEDGDLEDEYNHFYEVILYHMTQKKSPFQP